MTKQEFFDILQIHKGEFIIVAGGRLRTERFYWVDGPEFRTFRRLCPLEVAMGPKDNGEFYPWKTAPSVLGMSKILCEKIMKESDNGFGNGVCHELLRVVGLI